MPHQDLQFTSFEVTATADVVPSGYGTIYIYAVKCCVSAAVTVKWQEVAQDGTVVDLEGAQGYPANGGYVEFVPPPSFLFFVRKNRTLRLNINGAATVGGRVSYWRT